MTAPTPPSPGGNPVLEAALTLAGFGWCVFPVHSIEGGRCSCGQECTKPAKHPRTRNGFKDATTDERRIRRWWTRLPSANLGVATGAVSGLAVLDVDPDHGGDASLEALIARHGDLPQTLIAHTGGGGRHLYFRHPGEGRKVKCSTGELAPGLDVRGDGGYVVAPPSVHETGRQYGWGAECEPAALPEWLREFMTEGKRRGGTASPSTIRKTGASTQAGSPYGLAAMESEIAGLLSTDVGKRNHRLNRAAFCLGQLVVGGELPRDVVETRLLSAALAAGLRVDESPRTIQSGLESGLLQPRRAPEGNGRAARRPAAPTAVTVEEPWPAPRPLPPREIAPPPLPGDLLPTALRPCLEDTAQRLSVPLEFVTMPALVALGSAVGRACGIRPKRKDDWTVVPNLWGAIVSGPGKLKSAAASEGTRFLRRLASNASKEYRERMEANKQHIEVLDARRAGLKERVKKLAREGKDSAGSEEELAAIDAQLADLCRPERRYIIADATTAKVAALLADNTRGLCLVRDEVAGLFLSMTRSGCEGDREFYLEAWNGTDPYDVDRIGRGTIHIPALCLSVFGSIQPGKLQAFIEEATGSGSGADGLLQRLQLLVWPGDLGPFVNVDRYPDADARETAFRVFQRLAGDFPNIERDGDSGIPFLRFAPDAQELFYTWRAELETRLRSEELEASPAFAAHLAKYRSLIAALALLHYLAECAAAELDPVAVSLASVQKAAALVEYLEVHARRVYAVEIHREAHAAHDLLRRLREGDADSGVSVRDLQRRGWSGLTTPEDLTTALRTLEEHGWVRVVEGDREGKSGRPSKKVLFHPDLRGTA